MTIFNAITFAIAVLGAILGVINTWHAIDKSRVKLRVIPKHAIPVGGMDERLTFCIEVVNLSAFAVTIEETGVFLQGSQKRLVYNNPISNDDGKWPRRLEPRSSVTVYGERPVSNGGFRLKCAYARTSCGETRTGVSAAFKQISKGEINW